MKYIVKRPHQGDQWYNEGDAREADPRDVAHLVARGVLVLPEEGEAAEAPEDPEDSKASPAPETKASEPAETKGQE